MKFILMHGSSVPQLKVDAVVKAISKTCKLLDDTDRVYLFDGDKAIAVEVIDGMIGEFSITPITPIPEAETRTTSEGEFVPLPTPVEKSAEILEESRPKQEYVVGSCFDD